MDSRSRFSELGDNGEDEGLITLSSLSLLCFPFDLVPVQVPVLGLVLMLGAGEIRGGKCEGTCNVTEVKSVGGPEVWAIPRVLMAVCGRVQCAGRGRRRARGGGGGGEAEAEAGRRLWWWLSNTERRHRSPKTCWNYCLFG